MEQSNIVKCSTVWYNGVVFKNEFTETEWWHRSGDIVFWENLYRVCEVYAVA